MLGAAVMGEGPFSASQLGSNHKYGQCAGCLYKGHGVFLPLASLAQNTRARSAYSDGPYLKWS